MERNRKRRRIVQVLCGAVLFILLAGALLASPVDGLSGATPRSQTKGDSKLSGAYVLLLNSQRSPFDEEAACQAFCRFFSQRQAGLAPLAGQTVVLYIPKDDAALSAYSQSLVRRAASRQVTLTVRPLKLSSCAPACGPGCMKPSSYRHHPCRMVWKIRPVSMNIKVMSCVRRPSCVVSIH